jgi:glycosyltransferase involved in cell wall biosynthesis
MNCKISIIVPVYNVDNYLRLCLNSILIQTFADFEVILVDDGSTDGSGAICDEYSAKDERIKVFHKENGGVSSARNLALDCIKGEWVFFCDADDMLFENSLEVLVGLISDGIDSVCCGYVKISESNELLSYDTSEFSELLSSSDVLMDFYQPLFSKSKNIYLWNRLLKVSIISGNKLRFREDLPIKEDGLFLVQYLCRCKGKHKLSSIPVYKYRINLTSVMNTYGKSLNSKTILGLSAGIECSKEIQQYTDNVLLIKLSREFVAKRFFYLLLKTIKVRNASFQEVLQVTKDVLMFISAKDVLSVICKIIKKKK